jgi:hypothetical protein
VCELDSASCTGCTGSSDCAGYPDAPVCDAVTGGCRACALDAECASEVCDVDTGRCVAERDVIYASPGGSDTARCTHDQPCSVARAIVVAQADPAGPLVRLLPGTYSAPITISSGKASLVGSGALLRPTSAPPALSVRGTAVVEVRGLESDVPLDCRGTGNMFPVLTLRESIIRGTTIVEHAILHVFRSTLASSNFYSVTVFDDGILEADQSRFWGNPYTVHTLGRRIRVRITNSILEKGGLQLSEADSAVDRSEYYVSFSTFVLDRYQICLNPYDRHLVAVFENNIFYTPSGQVPNVINGNACTLTGNITFPQELSLGSTNLNQDPKFVNPQARDYRIQSGSPAVDAAVVSAGPALDHDFAGTPRPQGVRKDIGAFELQR